MRQSSVTSEKIFEVVVVWNATRLSDSEGSDIVDEYIDHVIIDDRTFYTMLEAAKFMQTCEPEEYD